MKVNYCPETDSPHIDLSSKPSVDSRERSDGGFDYAEVKDLEIINRHADDLNDEALDVLDYQLALPSEHDLNHSPLIG